MKLFAQYIKQRRRGLLAFALFCSVFAVTFALYRLPIGAVAYPAGLCVLLAAVMTAIDFRRVAARHKRVCSAKTLSASTMPDLPHADSIEESDLLDVIENLKTENIQTAARAEERLRDTVEYYTVWAHQIKTPISAMKLTLQNDDSPASRQLSSELFKIEQYVEMVMAYLRLDSESGDYVFLKHDLDRIIKNAVRRFSSEFIGRKIRLDYTPLSETLVTDEKWFSFVLEQILSNALKYTGEGGEIRIYEKKPKTLCISDNGIGIAAEDLPRVFEKGYTGCNGRNDMRASGIGLYLCKCVCEKLGTEISAESEEGKGTTVCIKFDQYDLNLTKE